MSQKQRNFDVTGRGIDILEPLVRPLLLETTLYYPDIVIEWWNDIDEYEVLRPEFTLTKRRLAASRADRI